MKIQIIAHTKAGDENKLVGRWSLIPFHLKKLGNSVDQILRKEWFSFPKRYNTFKPDVLITAGPIGAVIALLKKLHLIKIPVVHDWNDNYSEIMGKKWGSGIISLLENFAVKNSDIVITPSMYRLEKAKSLGKKENLNLFYVPHGIRREFFSKSKKAPLSKSKYKKLIYVGEQSAIKRVDLLINSMRNKEAELFLIGDTNKKFETSAPKNVHFLGRKAQKEVPNYLKAADFLVLTEDNDSALKLFEYLSTNKPILAPKGRISKYNQFGNILFYSDFNEIKKLVNSKVKIKKQSIQSWEKIAENYLKILKRLQN